MSHIKIAGQDVGQYERESGSRCQYTSALWNTLQYSSDGFFIVEVELSESAAPHKEATSVTPPNFRLVKVNPACRSILSMSRDCQIGNHLNECLPEALANEIVSNLCRCFYQRQEIIWKTSFSYPQQILLRLTPEFSSDGNIRQIVGLCQNLTKQQPAKTEIYLLQSITQACAVAEDFESALSVVLRHCCEATGWDYGEAWIQNNNGEIECSKAWYGSPHCLSSLQKISQELNFPLGIHIPERVWLTKQPEFYRHVSSEIETSFLRFGFRCALAIPILANDTVVATLVFFMFEVGKEERQMVELVSTAVAQLGNLIQRKQVEAALKESQRKLAHLIDSLPGIAFACAKEPEWTMIYISEGCYNLTGYKSEELIGYSRNVFYNFLTHSEDLPHVIAAIEKAIALKQSYVVEYRIHTKDGKEKWLWEKGIFVTNKKGEILGIEGFIIDISERKITEEFLKYRSEFEKTIATISTQFINLKSEEVEEGIKQALQRIGSFYKVERSYLSLSKEEQIIMYEWRAPEIEAQKYDIGEMKSKIAVPVIYQESLVGYIGIESVQADKKLPEEAIALLKIIGEICVSTLERKRNEEELKQAKEKYQSIFENAVEGIFQTTPDGHYLTANPMLARIYGYDSPAELINSITDIQKQLYVDPQRRSQFMQILQQQDAVWDFESEIYRKDGSKIWISENARAIRNKEGKLLGYEGTVVDITKRKKAESDLQKRDNLLQGVARAMNHLLTNPNQRAAVIEALATLGAATGVDRICIYENDYHTGNSKMTENLQIEWVREGIAPTKEPQRWHDLASGKAGMKKWYDILASGQTVGGMTPEFPNEIRQLLEAEGIVSILTVPILVNNQFKGYIGFEDCRNPRKWQESEESILMAMAASIGGALQRYQQEELIRYQALHDRLTGLPNRQLLDERLPKAIAGCRRRGNQLAIAFLDLDHFKIINDTLGHVVGDRLLQIAAQRLRSCLREDDTIVRWGGDEFILLLPHLNSAEDAAHIAQRILDVLQPAFEIDGHRLYVTSSIGIALYPRDGTDAETLMKNADMALYRAKERGRNNYQLYSSIVPI
ncbi:MAG: diguanylate cyclase [Oscillatoriaceae bacterium SKW80]|nr:diguanylate cyclase [Oscillatoriaceae bacterium SKYG93]MCX8121332.1 diguanylate cyclase [Oscillatoriaceae bacterium SKW80]MDW8453334.1 diguanylate cyclase [Oscillatoriaceae cyanobacterium SKYGB_i_bin93]HIK26688.1 diguanylate cyclase [Oscillatoriaceae cyanobacterium M7585_C2015_266]